MLFAERKATLLLHYYFCSFFTHVLIFYFLYKVYPLSRTFFNSFYKKFLLIHYHYYLLLPKNFRIRRISNSE